MTCIRLSALVSACGLLASVAGADIRSMDGSGNNLANPMWGAAGTNMIRGASGAHYVNGIDEMIDRGNPRTISNLVSAQVAPVGNARNLSSMVWQWGQFIDHDYALVDPDLNAPVPIHIPAGDPVFDPKGTGKQTMDFLRSLYTGGDGVPREHASILTHWIDGSQVYGSDDSRCTALREHVGGRLLVGEDNMLPLNTNGIPNLPSPAPMFRIAGDLRCNEQTGLAAMHTIFVREHNYWADRIAAAHPDWTDEEIFQKARKIVSGEIQAITYNEWLPALLGPANLPEYKGYDAVIDPSLNTVFSSAAFRIGHTLLNEQLLRFNEDGSEFEGGHLTLFQSFFNLEVIDSSVEVDAVIRGLARQQANEIDTQAVDSVRNMLFPDPGAGNRDLIAINIQRGRDHGIPDYNTVREDYGLPRVTSFSEITSDVRLQEALSTAYNGDVNNIDAWIGLMAEDHIPGASVGPTIAVIFRDQFGRLRNCDRMFYLNDADLTPEEIAQIHSTTLRDVIRRNTGIVALQPNVFFAAEPCSCDVTGDGILDTGDFFAFIECFLGGDCTDGRTADFNLDGAEDSQDFFDFLVCFFGGCA